MLNRARLRIYNVDEPLHLAGVRGKHEVNIILRGCVSLSTQEGEKATAGHGAVLGTWPVLLEQKTPFTLRAVSVVLAYGLPRQHIEVRGRFQEICIMSS